MHVFYWIAVAVVAVASAARITRLLTIDEFPPVTFFRDRYESKTQGSDWQALAYCPFCMSFWVTIGVVLWGYFTDYQDAWWLVNGIFGGSYLAAILVKKDGDE